MWRFFKNPDRSAHQELTVSAVSIMIEAKVLLQNQIKERQYGNYNPIEYFKRGFK